MFKQGLDKLIGIPASNVKGTMEREHQSTELFTTGNYRVTTFDKQEFALVDSNASVDYELDAHRTRVDVDELMKTFREDKEDK
eukprot:1982298-Rhodomonas_salina.1